MIKEKLGIGVSEASADLRELTIHYTISKYPNATNALPSDFYDESKARDLIARAKRVIEWVEQICPEKPRESIRSSSRTFGRS